MPAPQEIDPRCRFQEFATAFDEMALSTRMRGRHRMDSWDAGGVAPLFYLALMKEYSSQPVPSSPMEGV